MSKLTKEQFHFTVGIGVVLAIIIAIVLYRALTNVGANILDGLIYFEINPYENVTVNAGGSMSFTAEGNFGTETMPIRVNWSLGEGADKGNIADCLDTKQCVFTAGDSAGVVTLETEVGGGELVDSVQITIEQAELVNPFSDELPGWAEEAILALHQMGIITGYEDGTYGSSDPVTNGQAITLLKRIFVETQLIGEPANCPVVYGDVPQDHYAFIPACLFKAQGWSTQDANFQPNISSPRGETAGFTNRSIGNTLLQAMGLQAPGQVQIFDDVPVGSQYFNDTAVMNTIGVMTGYPTGDFGVINDLNRAEVAVVMYRILNRIQDNGVAAIIGYDPNATADEVDGGQDQDPAPADCMGSSSNAGNSCSDSDGGKNYPVQGTIHTNFATGMSVTRTDSCRSATTQREWCCRPDGTQSFWDRECPDGCQNGVCVGEGGGQGEEEEEEGVSCADLAASSYTYPDTDGNRTVYFKSYGIYLCTSGNDTALEIEEQNSGSNYPKISGNHIVYFQNYGIKLYNISTQQKTQVEPENSGSNKPTITDEYAAYFKSYGIYLHHIESHIKAEVEPPNSGCNNPQFNGDVLNYTCNGVGKTLSLTTPVTPTDYILPRDCVGESSHQGNTCTDSDGGYNPSQKGTGQANYATGVSYGIAEDCRWDGKLREWCCAPNGTPAFFDMTCQNGCSGGVCQ